MDSPSLLCVILATQTGDAGLASPMDVHVTTGTFHALVYEAIQQRATVVTKCRAGVRVDLKCVSTLQVIWCGGGHRAGAREGHKLVTSFVDHKTANLTLESLFPNAPA